MFSWGVLEQPNKKLPMFSWGVLECQQTKKKKKKEKKKSFFNTLCQSKLHPSCSSCCLILSMFLEKKKNEFTCFEHKPLQKNVDKFCKKNLIWSAHPRSQRELYREQIFYFKTGTTCVPEWAWYSVYNHLALRFIFGNRVVLFLHGCEWWWVNKPI